VLADGRPEGLEALDVSALEPVGLAEVLAEAAGTTRVDRKYLVPREVADALVARVADTHRVLTFDGRTSTAYRSTYFDTADLLSARAHVQQRRRRWKVRSRLYVEDGLCRVEVKTRTGADTTTKDVLASSREGYGALGGAEAAFVADALARYGSGVDVAALQPVAEVTYRRVTLADTAGHTRLTLDRGVASVLGDQRVRLDDRWVLVETKGGRRPSPADRALVALGARPRPFSKYVAAASLVHEGVRDNDVRALRGRQLHHERVAPAVPVDQPDLPWVAA
jgi:hypothetical protein